TKCNQMQPNATKCNQMQPNATKCNQMQPNATKCNQMQPNATKKTNLLHLIVIAIKTRGYLYILDPAHATVTIGIHINSLSR
ncbi:hypothetical protein, partial [Shewanella baltica]|uniref:hypothetical protein n=1 Tax=Shewanella baltica TaxID=62322 RepID=UPI00217D065C